MLVLTPCLALGYAHTCSRIFTPVWPVLQLLQHSSSWYYNLAIHQHGHACTVLTCAMLEEAFTDAGVFGFLTPFLSMTYDCIMSNTSESVRWF